MVVITREEVRTLAKVSALHVEEHEIDGLIQELQSVLDYASTLQTVVKKYENKPTASLLKTVNIVREDHTCSYDAQQLIERAPEHDDRYIVVPLIVKQ